MSAAFEFQNRVEFLPANADEILRAIPAAPGVFALRGEAENSEPYLTRTADLRRRLRRLLAPPEAVDEQGRPVLSKRLQTFAKKFAGLRGPHRLRLRIGCSSIVLRHPRAPSGPGRPAKRLRLHAPYFLRITMQHEHPRVYATNNLSRRALNDTF